MAESEKIDIRLLRCIRTHRPRARSCLLEVKIMKFYQPVAAATVPAYLCIAARARVTEKCCCIFIYVCVCVCVLTSNVENYTTSYMRTRANERSPAAAYLCSFLFLFPTTRCRHKLAYVTRWRLWQFDRHRQTAIGNATLSWPVCCLKHLALLETFFYIVLTQQCFTAVKHSAFSGLPG